jgi:hypothetical protein
LSPSHFQSACSGSTSAMRRLWSAMRWAKSSST